MNKIIKLLRIVQDPFFFRSLLKGTAAGVEHISVLKGLKLNYVLDIGANRGQFALIARKYFPQALIYSIEPLDEPADVFNRVFEDDPKVKLIKCAIGSEKHQAVIHVSSKDDSSSLLPIGQRQVEIFPHTRERETRVVPVFTINEIIDMQSIIPPALLKIDVQGYELDVLRGCQPAFKDFSYVYVECSFVELYEGQAFADDVISFLSNYEFKIRGIFNVHYDAMGRSIQADFFFSKHG